MTLNIRSGAEQIGLKKALRRQRGCLGCVVLLTVRMPHCPTQRDFGYYQEFEHVRGLNEAWNAETQMCSSSGGIGSYWTATAGCPVRCRDSARASWASSRCYSQGLCLKWAPPPLLPPPLSVSGVSLASGRLPAVHPRVMFEGRNPSIPPPPLASKP